MRFRKLRILWTVFCGIACVLLIALWVRSYWIGDTLTWHGSGTATLSSTKGVISGSLSKHQFIGAPAWQWGSTPTGSMMPVLMPRTWALHFYKDSRFVCFPHRLPIAVLISLAVAPWIRWYFSLRTLLIATTLVAMVLGLIVWILRA